MLKSDLYVNAEVLIAPERDRPTEIRELNGGYKLRKYLYEDGFYPVAYKHPYEKTLVQDCLNPAWGWIVEYNSDDISDTIIGQIASELDDGTWTAYTLWHAAYYGFATEFYACQFLREISLDLKAIEQKEEDTGEYVAADDEPYI